MSVVNYSNSIQEQIRELGSKSGCEGLAQDLKQYALKQTTEKKTYKAFIRFLDEQCGLQNQNKHAKAYIEDNFPVIEEEITGLLGWVKNPERYYKGTSPSTVSGDVDLIVTFTKQMIHQAMGSMEYYSYNEPCCPFSKA